MVSLQEWDSSSVQPQNSLVKALITQVAPAGENKGAGELAEALPYCRAVSAGPNCFSLHESNLKLQSDSPMM